MLKLSPGDDLQMMKTPDAWPLGSVLALMNKLTGAIGVLVQHPSVPRTSVYLALVYDGRIKRLPVDPECIPADRFDSFEAIVGAGWTVD